MELTLSRPYVEERNGGLYIAGKRISLDSIIYAYRRGEDPDYIARSFPVLELDQVYGAIAFYLANQDEIDVYLHQEEERFEIIHRESRERNRDLIDKIKAKQDKINHVDC